MIRRLGSPLTMLEAFPGCREGAAGRPAAGRILNH